MPRTDATSAVLSQVVVWRGVGFLMETTVRYDVVGNKDISTQPMTKRGYRLILLYWFVFVLWRGRRSEKQETSTSLSHLDFVSL